MNRRDFLTGIAGLTTLDFARAQTWPDRPIRLVVPFPAGGVNDSVAHPVAERLKSLLGTIVIENRGGAGGTLGATQVVRADPDGYTLLIGSGATHIVGPLTTGPSYDPVKDLRAISIIAVSGIAICVHPSLPVRTMRELIDYAKANPGKLSYASAGVGSATHLGAELFKSLAKTPDIAHVPYRGGAPATTDLAAGQIMLGFLNVSGQLLELHKAGKIHILAVTKPDRIGSAPDIPTGEEAGLPGLIALNFAGLFAPAKTPEPIITRISTAMRAATADPVLQRVLTAAGLELSAASDPEKASRFIDEEITRWTPIIKALNFKTE